MVILLFASDIRSQSVGINSTGTAPDNSAMLDISSPDKGVLIPRMDSTARMNIVSPAIGLMVYDNTYNSFYYFNGMAWSAIGGDGDNLGDHVATQNIQLNGFWLSNDSNINTPEGILVDTNGYVGVNTFPQNNFQVGLGKDDTQTTMINQLVGGSLGDEGTNWQSFTATDYAYLTAFQIYQVPNSPGIAGWDFSLYEGEGTSGTLLASGNSSTTVFYFNEIPLIKDKKYTVLFTETSDANIFLALINPYPGGTGNGVAHYDFRFSVYVKGINTGLSVSTSGVSFENYNFPAADGSANQILASDGAGSLSWSSNSTGLLEDADQNTKVQVEKNANEDIIRFDLGGTQRWVMEGSRFHNNASNLFIGLDAGLSQTSGTNLTAFGANALRANTTGNNNTAIGLNALYSNTIGHSNTALGTSTLQTSSEGSGNTAVGHNALLRNTTGWNNVAMGVNAMQNVTTGNRNVGMGDNVLTNTTTGSFNVAVGSSTGSAITTGTSNTLVGYEVGRTMDTGSQNVMVGMYSGINSGNISRATLVGLSAGTNGSDNMTAIGFGAGQQSGVGGVYLGYSAGQAETGDNKLYIDNTNTPTPLIWGDFANDSLKVFGTFNINDAFNFPATDGSNGQLLQTDGAGQLSWGSAGGGQTLNINANDSLFISGGNGVNLSPYLDNTDNQQLTISNDSLWLTNDTTGISLNSYLDNTDNQQLTLSGNDLSLTNGELPINLSSFLDADDLGNHTATQDIIIGGNAIRNNSSSANGLSIGAENQLLVETEFQRSGHFLTTGVNEFGNPFGNYLEVNNKTGTRAIFGSDGNGLYSLDTLNTIVGNWTANGGITYHVNGGVKVMTLDASGRLGIGRTATTNTLEVEGNASKTTAGNWLANSDSRLKKNITSLSSEIMLDKMLSLQGVTYEWNDNQTGTSRPEGIQYGFTAQNIQEVFPTLVTEDNNGFLQTPYGTYDAMTVEAIRALNEKIERLELLSRNLAKENARLKSQNQQQAINTVELSQLKNAFAELEALIKENKSSTAVENIQN